MILGAAAVYALAFGPIYRLVGEVVAAFTVIPVALAGWLLGARAGLLAGVAGIFLNVLNFTLVGQVGWETVLRRWPAVLVSLAAGVVAGWASEGMRQASGESREARFERDRFFDLSMDLLCIAGTDGYFKRVNSAWERTLGFSREELCAKPFIEFVHPDDRIRTQEVMKQLSCGQPAVNFENRYLCRDGSYRWLTWAIPAPEQDPPVLYAAARDITELKQKEEALRQANDELGQCVAQRTHELVLANDSLRIADSWQRALIEAIQGIVWECDARTWRFTFVSHHAEPMLGYPVRRWLDEPDFWPRHIHPDDRAWAMDYCLTSSRTERKYSFEYRMIAADGRTVWLQDIVTVEADEDGPLLLRGVMVDITHRKEAEERLRQSEAFFSSVVDNLPNMVFVKDAKELRFVRLNKAGEALLGYSHHELVGRNDHDFFPPEEAGDFTAADWRVLSGGQLLDIPEEPIQTKHQGVRYLHTKKIPICDASGEPQYLLGISEDITERKQMEEVLCQTTAQLAAVIDSSPLAIVMLDRDLLVRLWNQAAERIFGWTAGEVLGQPHPIIPEEKQEEHRAFLQQAFQNQPVTNREVIRRRKDGTRIHVSLSTAAIRGDGGVVCGVVGILQDITERKQAEEALRASEERCSSLVSQATDIIYTANMEGRFTFVNAAACSIMQYGEQELLGRHYLDLVRPDYREAVQAFYKRQVAEQIPATYCEFPARTRRGEEVWLGQHVRLRVVDGRMEGVEVIARDITERKRMEAALQESELRLRRAVEEREQLSQDLHDNIIQSVYAIGMGLEECRHLVRENPAEGDKKLDLAIAGLNRVITDVRNYLVWEKPEEITPRELPAKLAELVVMMESVEGLRFSLDVDPTVVQRMTSTAASQLLHIVHEAMSNSLRHSKSRSGLVSLRTEERRIRLEVTDDGVGFDPAQAAGRGQGLGNMAARAQKLGARFQVVSMPGQGTQILIEMPLEEPHAARSR